MIAIPWLVLVTTGSPAKTGLVAFAEMAPLVAVKAGAGPLIDRVGARRVAIGCDLASTVVVGLIPLLHFADSLTFGALVVLVALAGALRGPGDGAKAAFVPALTTHAAVPLERVTGSDRRDRTVGQLHRLRGRRGSGRADRGGERAGCRRRFLRRVRCRVRPLDAGYAVGAGRRTATRDVVPPGVARRLGLPAHRRRARRAVRDGGDTNLLDLAFAAVLVPVWARDSGLGAGAVGTLFACSPRSRSSARCWRRGGVPGCGASRPTSSPSSSPGSRASSCWRSGSRCLLCWR